ncbi:glutathione peroxidase [Bacillus sp. FJAT-45350]|uniref:glutathione peroxidase n=1 Tax=Bacillus sp. FJAT-45350 TaxID=2011014 RepID=UPI000BB89226|nr:glutathione peroxidase [Bacillus sp. FJAT-45350]
MSVHQFTVEKINGEEVSLSNYEGKVMLIVNTATKCGLAPQFKELQKLYEEYGEIGFVVLGFPSNQFLNQEPGTDEEVSQVCELNFGVTFPLFKKSEVKGPNAHPLFKHLTKEKKGLFSSEIKWNFTKFLVDKKGNVIKRYAPATKPGKIESDIKGLLEA